MKQFGKSALLFVAIGLLLYAGVFVATERLLLRNWRKYRRYATA